MMDKKSFLTVILPGIHSPLTMQLHAFMPFADRKEARYKI